MPQHPAPPAPLPTELPVSLRIVITAAAVAAAGVLDAFTGPDVQAVFYLPAILLATFLCGWQCGAAAYVGSLLVAWYLVQPISRSEINLHLWDLAFFAAGGGIILCIAVPLRNLYLEAKRMEARLRGLAEATSDIIFMTDRHGHIHDFHPSFSRVIGIEWDSYRGEGWRGAIHEEDRPKLTENLLADAKPHSAELRVRDAKSGTWRWFRLRLVPLADSGGMIHEWVGSLTDIHDAVLAREQRELLLGELRHRMKNLMTVIEALAKNSRSDRDPAVEAYLKRFLGRLHTLGAAADNVLAGGRTFIEVGAVIRATLAPFSDDRQTRIAIDGLPLHLSEQTGGGLAMAVHELATNALKYGALSVPGGRVSVNWMCEPKEDGEEIVIEWKENGGPPPMPPAKSGFGMRVIAAAPAREKNGDVIFQYQPDGLYCRIRFIKAAAT